MGQKKAATRITAQDLARDGGLAGLIEKAVKHAASGGDEEMELAAGRLSSLAEQNHSAHADEISGAGAVPALVHVLAHGNAAAQASAAKALHFLAHNRPQHRSRACGGAAARPDAPPGHFPGPAAAVRGRALAQLAQGSTIVSGPAPTPGSESESGRSLAGINCPEQSPQAEALPTNKCRRPGRSTGPNSTEHLLNNIP